VFAVSSFLRWEPVQDAELEEEGGFRPLSLTPAERSA